MNGRASTRETVSVMIAAHFGRHEIARRVHEFCAAPRRGADRIRAPVLGCQRQRNIRAAGLLRSICLARELSARDAELSYRADGNLDRNLWRRRLVHGHFWR